MDLRGKTALVTGASRGIGLAIAELFAASGADLALNCRSLDSLTPLCAALEERYGVKVYALPYDVADPDQVKVAFRELFNLTKRLDILVNNAGVIDSSLIGMVTPAQVERLFTINTFSVLYTSQYAARLMSRNKNGSIINLGSILGVEGAEGYSVYGGSKAALLGISRSLAKELAPSGIRVNVISPGFIDTDMTRDIPEKKYLERKNSIGMGRVGTPGDVANVALFLASEMSNYVTGQVIGVDGGMLI